MEKCESAAHPDNTPMPSPILPGAAVGVLGSGQLGRMFAIGRGPEYATAREI